MAVSTSSVDDSVVERICADLGDHGLAIVPGFVDAVTITRLAATVRQGDANGEFHDAAVGRGALRAQRGNVRGDRIRWLDAHAADATEASVLAALDAVRHALNASLFLGLSDFECHYAIYPTGATYQRHLDRFRDDDARVVSCVLYLNKDWTNDDGGQLRLHTDTSTTRDILPCDGTLVCFLSGRLEHEVLAARRERIALTGWFKRRMLGR
jgi:SM-20-related protein